MAKNEKELSMHDKDTGSSEVQVAQLTNKIENLSKHIKQFKKDKHSSVGLLRAVNRRKKLLEGCRRKENTTRRCWRLSTNGATCGHGSAGR